MVQIILYHIYDSFNYVRFGLSQIILYHIYDSFNYVRFGLSQIILYHRYDSFNCARFGLFSNVIKALRKVGVRATVTNSLYLHFEESLKNESFRID